MVANQPIPSKGGSLFGSTTVVWEDVYKGPNVMWRVPRNIRMNDNIVIREDEIACFFRDGKVLAYLDRPGRFALTSLNAPLLGGLMRALSGVRQEAEVYYLQRRIFDGKFGSAEPYVFRDPDFGMVNLRLFGNFRWKVGHPDLFVNQFVGTFGAATSDDVEGRLRSQVVILVYNTLCQVL
ncbi:MAG: SPFH domain-containing protein, partial [Thermoplasmata archaeon]